MTEPYPQQWPPPAPPPVSAYPPPPPRLPDFPHPEPRPYHLMLRTWNYAAWRPVVGIIVVFVSLFIVAPLVLLPVLAAGVAVTGRRVSPPLFESMELLGRERSLARLHAAMAG